MGCLYTQSDHNRALILKHGTTKKAVNLKGCKMLSNLFIFSASTLKT